MVGTCIAIVLQVAKVIIVYGYMAEKTKVTHEIITKHLPFFFDPFV
jgi:hypothetical protein